MSKALGFFAKLAGGVIAVSAAAGAVAFVKQEADRKKERPCAHKQGLYERYLKRPLDCGLATGALIVLSPVMAVTAGLVRKNLGSPVIFAQDRPGKDEKIFKLYKFRSMTDARDKNGKPLSDDERLTPFGRKLRASSLDELPELFNIVKGDMAIVGPRPLLVEYIPYYTEKEHHRHNVRPGLTGLAQVHGRNAVSWDEKFDWDLTYVNEITFVGDVKIILTTIRKVLKRSDVLVGKEIPAGRLDVARSDNKYTKV